MSLPLETVLEVKRLFLENVPQREIARRVGVSRGSVATIVHDRWRPAKWQCATPEPDQPSGPFVRCECGFLVQQPCRICQAIAVAKRVYDAPDPDEASVIQMEEAHRERYEQLRARKEALRRLASEPPEDEPPRAA